MGNIYLAWRKIKKLDRQQRAYFNLSNALLKKQQQQQQRQITISFVTEITSVIIFVTSKNNAITVY